MCIFHEGVSCLCEIIAIDQYWVIVIIEKKLSCLEDQEKQQINHPHRYRKSNALIYSA